MPIQQYDVQVRQLIGFAMLAVSGVCLSAALAGLPAIAPEKALSRPGPIERGSDADAKGLLGKPAPDLPKLRWLDGKERSLVSLEGSVVLIRSFTNDCPFCAATMPFLERVHREYERRGLIVLGIYHPKPPRPTTRVEVGEFSQSLGLTFPVAIDDSWLLVNSWWLAGREAGWTSVTWLLDRRGTIRYIHPGGEYHDGGGPDHARCRQDAHDIRQTIQKLLAEPAGVR